MADRRVDLIEEGVDLAIRLGALDDSSFVSRRVATAPRYIVASPGYIARRGAPTSPSDLAGHEIIADRAPGKTVWTLKGPQGGETSVRLVARLVATSTEGVVAAVVAGLGLATASAFACRAELKSGQLVQLLTGYSLPPIDVQAIMPTGRRPSGKARAFVEYLAEALSGAT